MCSESLCRGCCHKISCVWCSEDVSYFVSCWPLCNMKYLPGQKFPKLTRPQPKMWTGLYFRKVWWQHCRTYCHTQFGPLVLTWVGLAGEGRVWQRLQELRPSIDFLQWISGQSHATTHTHMPNAITRPRVAVLEGQRQRLWAISSVWTYIFTLLSSVWPPRDTSFRSPPVS